MTIELLDLQIARSKIQRYEHGADESTIQASRQAQDCLDCEEFLDQGITAYRWLERCEGALEEATCEGVIKMTQPIEEAIEILYESWRRPSNFADKWIATCQKNGFDVKNRVEFHACCERVQDWLERHECYKRSREARNERFAQEPW